MMAAQNKIAVRLAEFACAFDVDDAPAAVRERACYSILDAIGVALAAGRFDFARRAADAVSALADPGRVPVIGLLPLRLQMRDAAFLNGILVHGLDYDDTHLLSAIHPTASLLPTVLAVGYERRSSGAEMLAAYIVGLEAIARLGMFGGVRLRELSFHPTSMIGIFGCALAAGRLLGLDASALAMAQGIALSMASGTVGSPADGASNKRLHPGWASQAGITAAFLAKAGIKGPSRPYEGVRGLFRVLDDADGFAALSAQMDDLGTVWEAGNIAVKPMPACHLIHACADAATFLRSRHRFAIEDIRRITALVPAGIVQAVCEPLDLRRRPADSYAAQFSIPYVVAASLVCGTFGLAELDPAAIGDPVILDLAAIVDYEVDEASTYPVHRTGEVRIELKDGTKVSHRETINRGAPDRPLSLADIAAKFRANAALAVSSDHADRIANAVLAIEDARDGRVLVDAMCGSSAG